MKKHIERIKKMFLISLVIMSLGYSGVLTFATDAVVDDLTISAGDKVIISSNVTLTVNGAIIITGELEMATGSVVDVTGGTTVAATGTLDMDGTSNLKIAGDLSFNGTLETDTGNRILLDGSSSQTISGSPSTSPTFNRLFCSSSATVFNLTATIDDTLDAGGQNFTISADKTLTMASGSVTVLSGGTWTRDGTLTLNSSSKVLYTTSDQSTMNGQTYGNVEHNGGTLSQGGAFTLVNGTFTNTSGNFAASQSITANRIVWTAGTLTGLTSSTWNIGTGGIDINGGTFVATSGSFTVAGDWDMTGSGTFTPGTGTVIFDGTSVQSITSASQSFYSVTNSNTDASVSITDKFEINSSDTLTIDEGATFATAGNEFDHNGGTITNNGTFEIHGDETFTAGSLSIPGNTKVVDPSGCTLTTQISGLENVEFNSSGQTFSLADDTDYITGDITVAANTTFNIGAFDLTVADRKTVTNNGTWSTPSSGSKFTCSGNATLAGENMNFYEFYAVSTNADTIIFQGAKTYTIANNLTLGGEDGSELFITSNVLPSRAIAIIENTGGSQSVDYVKVYDVNGTTDNHISATNSWSLGGTTDYWEFAAMLYTFETTGDWDTATNWEQGVLPRDIDNIFVNSGLTLSTNGNRTINEIDIDGTLAVDGANGLTINGASDVDGSIQISTGTVDANGIFDATNGSITFSGAGSLTLASTVTSLGTLSSDNGTVTYDALGDQTIVADSYNSLTAGGTGTKTLSGDMTVNSDFTINDGVTAAVSANTLTIIHDTDINGTITISTGTIDANGNFDVTDGTISFTDAGNLLLGGDTITNLGTLSSDHGTVTYDGGNQTIVADAYNSLTAGGSGTKTLASDVIVNSDFTVNVDVTTAVGANTLTITDSTDINGTITISSGTIDANGDFDATDGFITFTGDGNLALSSTVTTLGTLSSDNGPVTYDGTDQTLRSDTYYNLVIGGPSGTKTLQANISTNGNFTVNSGITTSVHAASLIVTDSTDINGTITVTTGKIDANGAFDATGGEITFLDDNGGDLQLALDVTSLGALTSDKGTVTYDGGDQDIISGTYHNLVGGSSGQKTLSGEIISTGNITIDSGVVLSVSADNHNITVGGDWSNNGSFSSNSGTIIFNGTANQVLTPGSSSFYNLTLNNTGTDNNLTIAAAIDINNALALTAGTLDLDASDPDISIGGDLTIASGAVWSKGSGTVTFDGAAQSLSDLNTTPNNIGIIIVD